MSRDEKIALCRRLKGEGLGVRAIAARTGIPRATVGNYLLGDEHNRQIRLARGFKCPNCRQSVLEPINTMCGDCIAERARGNALKVERMWLAGKSLREIAAALGWTVDSLGVMMQRYRDQGYNLPYRRLGPRRPGKHPELRPDRVAA